jgi:hypothetical protein
MNRRLPAALSTADLPLAELCGAALDGELYPLGDAWCPVDQPESAVTRALAVAAVLCPVVPPPLPHRLIAERMTAAWVFGACGEPSRHQFCVDVRERARVPASPRYRVREAVGAAAESQAMWGLRLTTPLRTLVDLCRDTSLSTTDAVPVIRCLLEHGLVDAAEAARRLARSYQRRATRERFTAALQPAAPADPAPHPAESYLSGRELPAEPAISSGKVTLIAPTSAAAWLSRR